MYNIKTQTEEVYAVYGWHGDDCGNLKKGETEHFFGVWNPISRAEKLKQELLRDQSEDYCVKIVILGVNIHPL